MYKVQERKQYSEFKEISQSQPWFKVYDIGHDISAIYEPYHFQEVISYLIKGKDKALLFDTGLGVGNIRKCVEEIWNGEYEVFNSHHHFDHIGDDWRFEKIYAYNHPVMIKALSEPLPDEYIKPQFEADQFSDDAPVKTHVYEYKPVSFRLIEEGYVFSLGDRLFRVMHTPGHTEDAVMLVNDKEKLLFTGDTYYPAPLYCFEDTFDVYTETMKKLADNYTDYLLITSHNEPLRQGSIFKDIYEGFTKIMNHEIKPAEYPGEREFYTFKNFSLIKKKEGKTK